MKIGSFSLDTALSLDAHFLDNEEGSHSAGHGSDAHGGVHGHGTEDVEPSTHAHEAFGHMGLEVADPVNIEAFKDWMRELIARHAEELFRCKGVLYTTNGRHVVVQGVGCHIEIGEE